MAAGTEYDSTSVNDPDNKTVMYYDENGNLTTEDHTYGKYVTKLIRMPGVDPDTFNAEDYKDNYVARPEWPKEVGAYSAYGKKLEE